MELNWTLLTVALSGTHFDVKLSWKAPQTADVTTGWMTLQYDVQHREGDSDTWTSVGVHVQIHAFDTWDVTVVTVDVT